jgi:hypothetical protein
MRIFTKISIRVFMAVVSSCGLLSAQTSGSILGRVSDQTGAFVAGATVTAENLGTGLIRRATSSAEGSYLFPSLPTGSYKLTVESPGFKTFSQSGITLQLAENLRVDAALELGSVTENVTVEANALRVDTQSTTIGAAIDNQRLTGLPLNGRNALALAQLLPGVGQVTAPVSYGRANGPTMNVSGSRATDNNIMLDGTTFYQAQRNTGLNLPSPDTLEEFKILTNTFSAEYGRGGGGVVLAITKSGTNMLHGSLWEFLRNTDLNSRNFFSAGAPVLKQNQFGGSVGGPVKLPGYDGHNKTFFFASYQGLRIRQENLIVSNPPSAAELRGDFSGSTRAVIDPSTGQPFPGNQIPTTRFDPMAMNMIRFYAPTPNLANGQSIRLRLVPTTGNQVTVKGDHNLSSAHRLSFRYFRDRYELGNQSSGSSDLLTAPVTQNVKSFTGSMSSVLRPNLMNEVRISYTRAEAYNHHSPNAKGPRELGGNYDYGTVGDRMSPIANVSGRMNLTSLSPVIREPDISREFNDKISWIKGRHNVVAGVRIQRMRHAENPTEFNTGGNFSFSGIFSGNAMADFVIGRPSQFQQYSDLLGDATAGQYQAFAQDDFKVNRHLTLNLGVRYEYNSPWVQRYGNTTLIIPGRQSTKFPTAPPGLVVAGDPGVLDTMWPPDKNNWAPRVGLAWDPTGTGRTVIRSAYGVFYVTAAGVVSSWGENNAPWALSVQFVPPSMSDPYRAQVNPTPYDPRRPVFYEPLLVYTVSQNVRDAYVQQWNTNIQHQFGNDLVIQAGYVGKVAHKLELNRDSNPAVYGPGATASNIAQRRPFAPPHYDALLTFFTDSDSNYHSLQANMQKRFSRGYTFQAAYTFSKSIDNAGPVSNPLDYGRAERGLSTFDQRHVVALNGVWEIPFLRKRRSLLATLVGGWNINGTVLMSSGLPYNVQLGVDNALNGGTRGSVGNQRPNVVGNPVLDSGRPHSQLVSAYFNTAAFARPAIGQYGNLGRDALIGPAFSQTNMALAKQFVLPKERLGRFEFRAEFFNLLNQVNFNNPDLTQTSPTFGRLTSAKDPRIVQFGLRYDF